MTKALPQLLDDAGHLKFLVAEATPDDDAGTLGFMLAAMIDDGAVGLHVRVEAMSAARIYFPAGLYSIGAPSDALVTGLAAAWALPGAAMVPAVPCWIWPPRANFKGGEIQNARGYRPADLAAAEVELSLQITGDDKRPDELAWFPLVFGGGYVEMHLAADERTTFMKMLTGAVRARHFPDD